MYELKQLKTFISVTEIKSEYYMDYLNILQKRRQENLEMLPWQ